MVNWLSHRISRREERGAVLVIAAAGLALSLVAAALSVDLGRLALEKRTDQKIADLAALDAVRDFANIQAAATASALRNGFVPDGTHTITAVEGTLANGSCQVALGSGKACVTVSSPVDNEFLPGGHTVQARALAELQNRAGFTIGSGVAGVDTKKSILDPMIGEMIGGAVDVASYQGLADATVSLAALQTQLLAMGLDVGTPEQLLNADITLAQLFTATGNALVLNGDTVNAAVFCSNNLVPLPVNCNRLSLAREVTRNRTLRVRNLLEVAAGSESAAVATQFNLFQLLTGSATVINGTNAVSVPAVNLGIPGASTTTGSLKLIEKSGRYFGPVKNELAPDATTSQADLTVTTALSVLGTVTGTVSVRVTGGTADGWLREINCTNTPRYTIVHVEAHAATVLPTAALSISGTPLTTTFTSRAPGGQDDLRFEYPFYPNPSNPPQQSVGSNSLNITSNVASTGNAVLDATVADLRPIVEQVVDAIDTKVIQPILDSLGLSMGNADVMGLEPLLCGSPVLVG